MKKKLTAVITGTMLGAIALAGCASASPEASPSAAGPLAAVEWSEDAAGVPTVTFEEPFAVTESSAQLVQDGDGTALEEGQIISLAYTITNGADGEVAYSTYEEGRSPEAINFDPATMDPALVEVLTGAHVGADFMYTVVNQGTDATVPAETVIMAVTVVDAVVPLEKAEGEAVAPVDGLPVVTLDATGKPSVTIPETDPPAELVAQPTIKGDGDVVEEGDSVTVHYTGWVWDGGTQFDSSWDRGAPASFSLSQGQLIDGWIQGLAGQTVGSQVLLVIPPELGYGEEGSGDTIPGGASLVFVVDILAAS